MSSPLHTFIGATSSGRSELELISQKHTNLPIIVKGIQSLEDVQMCVDAGVEGVILSNHGGRQCD